MLNSADEVGFAVAVEIARLHIHPSHIGIPLPPIAVNEAEASGLGQPPTTVLLNSSNEVSLAVAVEVPRVHVHPSGSWIPSFP